MKQWCALYVFLHSYTRSAQNFHIPCVITDLGKTGIRYRGAVIWNIILRDGIKTGAVLKKCMIRLITAGTLRCGVVTVVALWLMVAPGVVTTTASATAWGCSVIIKTIVPYHYIPVVYSLLHMKISHREI